MPTEAPLGQLISDLPPRVRLAHDALREADLFPAKDSRVIGGYAWIECEPQMSTAHLGDYREMARLALRRKAGLNVRLKDITIDEVAGRIIVRVPVRMASKRASEEVAERLVFKKLPGDNVVAITPFSPSALLNTYNDFAETLKEIRTVVVSRRATSVEELRRKFARSKLAKVTNRTRWEEWKRGFASRELTAKNAALVLLEDTTGQKRSSLKTMLSRAGTNGYA